MTTTSSDRFCEHCEYDLGLHPSGKQTDEPFECEIAESRANLIGMFFAIFTRQV